MFRKKKRKLQNELNIDINFAEKPVLGNGIQIPEDMQLKI